jgi:hypothetical protein
MSTTLEPSSVGLSAPYPAEPLPTEDSDGQGEAQPYVLEDRLPEWLKWSPVSLVWVAIVGVLFWVQSFQKIHYTDIWGHVEYGRLLWETGKIPATEPLMPLSAGMPFVDTAWGSQVLAYLTQAKFGPAGIQFLHALSIALAAGGLLWRFARVTRGFWVPVAGFALFVALNWEQMAVTRPQLAGIACYVALLVLLTGRWTAAHWGAIPLLFLVWTNLHGSFVMGLGLLACAVAGRAADLLFAGRGVRGLTHDGPLARLLVVTQLAFMATLVNPYGLALYHEVLPFAANNNLADLIEWQPLHVRTFQGQMVAAVIVALAVVYRLSPRRVTSTEVFALVGVGFAMLWSNRFLVWWAPLATLALVWHGHAILSRRAVVAEVEADDAEPVAGPKRKGVFTLCAVGLMWIFFAFTPFGLRVIHGPKAAAKSPHAANTPVGAAAHLVKNPPVGQIFNTYEWGDYLGFAGPRGLRIFVNSHAHLVHPDIWKHYLAVVNVSAGWDDLLDLYGVNTVVVDKRDRQSLITRLKEHEKWTLSYEDNTAVIYVRKQAI